MVEILPIASIVMEVNFCVIKIRFSIYPKNFESLIIQIIDNRQLIISTHSFFWCRTGGIFVIYIDEPPQNLPVLML